MCLWSARKSDFSLAIRASILGELSFPLPSWKSECSDFRRLSHVNDNLNRVQLVPQGTFWCSGLWLDCGDWWVFPVFKPTYGLSKAVAERLLFFLHYIFISFLHRLSLSCFSWLCCKNTDQSFGSWDGDTWPKQSSKNQCGKMYFNLDIHHSTMWLTTPTDPFCGCKTTWVCPQNCLIYLTKFCKLGLSTLKTFWGWLSGMACTASIKTHANHLLRLLN